MANEEVKVYDWDDEITNDGYESTEVVTLPEGNYPFKVIKVDKSFYDGSSKIPPCNMAKVTMLIDGGELGNGMCTENLYLTEKQEWKAAQFLRSIGLKKHGEPVKWRLIADCTGEEGRCRVIVDKFTDKNNNERENNKVDKYFDKEEQAPKKEFKRGAF